MTDVETTPYLFVFTYPDFGTPDGFPHLTAHSGQTCTIVRELGDDERDLEVGRMFIVRFADGSVGTANADELDRLVRCPQAPDSNGVDGCGHEFRVSLSVLFCDPDGWADCPNCGLGFDPGNPHNGPQPLDG